MSSFLFFFPKIRRKRYPIQQLKSKASLQIAVDPWHNARSSIHKSVNSSEAFMASSGARPGTSTFQLIAVDDIHLDRDNPRIRKFLEMYGEDPSPEDFYLALGAAGGEEGD